MTLLYGLLNVIISYTSNVTYLGTDFLPVTDPYCLLGNSPT